MAWDLPHSIFLGAFGIKFMLFSCKKLQCSPFLYILQNHWCWYWNCWFHRKNFYLRLCSFFPKYIFSVFLSVYCRQTISGFLYLSQPCYIWRISALLLNVGAPTSVLLTSLLLIAKFLLCNSTIDPFGSLIYINLSDFLFLPSFQPVIRFSSLLTEREEVVPIRVLKYNRRL